MKPRKNLLQAVHDAITNHWSFYRRRVCEECGFSLPTFYRKMRSMDRLQEGRLVQGLTGAETSKMREIIFETLEAITGELNHLVKTY